MNLISINNIGYSVNSRNLFSGLSFGVDSESRIAVTGRNGSGKSTLLKIIAGKLPPAEGDISWNRELKTAFLEQIPEYNGNETLAEFVLAGEGLEINLIRKYESIITNPEADTSTEEFADLIMKIDELDCWNLENRIHSILSELGITELSRRTGELSGGMLKKALLARTLVLDSNLIILDEPTNHLDIKTINWLEKYLINSRKAILLVTHDRYFMDSICSRIIEIEDGSTYSYDGNYSRYLELKALRDEADKKSELKLNNILRNEAEWIKRGPRARAGKDKKRKENFMKMQDEIPQQKVDSETFSVEGKRLGGKILEIQNISKSWDGNFYIKDFSYSFKKGARVGILGGNGSGKTTLLNIIAGIIEPDSGEITSGINTKIVYYDQLSKELPDNVKVIEYIKETAEIIKLQDGSVISPEQFLQRFLFPKHIFYTQIERLSGGEKKKLYLLKLLLTNPNFIIMDEPTNDFDIQTLSILEDFLNNFAGCIIIVSHDRFFLDRTTDYLFILEGNGNISGYSGDVTSYYSEIETKEKQSPKNSKDTSGSSKQKTREKTGLSFKEKKELSSIEEIILQMEEEKNELDSIFSSPDADVETFSSLKKRYEELEHLIEEKYSRWEYLESI